MLIVSKIARGAQIVIAASLLGVSAVEAHIVLAEPSALPEADYIAAFKIGHGCDGSPTLKVQVDIPDSVHVDAVPEKPGWQVTPITEGERIVSVEWEGRLEPADADQFELALKLPPETGLIYFPTTQTCESGENRWTEIPPMGAAWNSVPRPAPVLDVTLTPVPEISHEHHH